MSGVVTLLALFVVVSAAQCEPHSGNETHYPELPNFHRVNDHLYRGAQPAVGGIHKLRKLGIKTIINLRGKDEDTGTEAIMARIEGLSYFSRPLPDLKAPTDDQVNDILAIIDDKQNWPVFVHCNHGKDRTGTIIACYRISRDGWTSECAKAEAKHYGISPVQFKMKKYITHYGRRYSQLKSSITRAANAPITK